jgi:hypothetical protein
LVGHAEFALEIRPGSHEFSDGFLERMASGTSS